MLTQLYNKIISNVKRKKDISEPVFSLGNELLNVDKWHIEEKSHSVWFCHKVHKDIYIGAYKATRIISERNWMTNDEKEYIYDNVQKALSLKRSKEACLNRQKFFKLVKQS